MNISALFQRNVPEVENFNIPEDLEYEWNIFNVPIEYCLTV